MQNYAINLTQQHDDLTAHYDTMTYDKMTASKCSKNKHSDIMAERVEYFFFRIFNSAQR